MCIYRVRENSQFGSFGHAGASCEVCYLSIVDKAIDAKGM